MTMEMKHFTLHDLELKEDGDSRTVEGYASVFNNIDSWNDIVMPGAFVKTLKKQKTLPMLWQHDSAQVIGMWDEMEERDKGLFVKGSIIDTTMGNDAYKLTKAGAVKGMSIGYGAEKYEIDQAKGTRKLLEIKLYEVSLVTFPANEKAQVTAVKARPQTIRRIEEYLREGGFSQQDATTVALRGYKALAAQGEPDAQTRKLTELFNRFTA